MDDRTKQRLLDLAKVAVRTVGMVAAAHVVASAIRDGSRAHAGPHKAFLIRCRAVPCACAYDS
jgi:hypothetical protein